MYFSSKSDTHSIYPIIKRNENRKPRNPTKTPITTNMNFKVAIIIIYFYFYFFSPSPIKSLFFRRIVSLIFKTLKDKQTFLFGLKSFYVNMETKYFWWTRVFSFVNSANKKLKKISYCYATFKDRRKC